MRPQEDEIEGGPSPSPRTGGQQLPKHSSWAYSGPGPGMVRRSGLPRESQVASWEAAEQSPYASLEPALGQPRHHTQEPKEPGLPLGDPHFPVYTATSGCEVLSLSLSHTDHSLHHLPIPAEPRPCGTFHEPLPGGQGATASSSRLSRCHPCSSWETGQNKSGHHMLLPKSTPLHTGH